MKSKIILLTSIFSLSIMGCSNKQYHTVTFDTHGGNQIDSQIVEHGNKAEKPDNPTRKGYEFVNWTYCGEEWSFVGYSVTEDMTIDANWSIIDYAITYNLNGGDNSSDNPLIYTVEDTISFADPSRTGYTFLGWFDQGGKKVTTINQGTVGGISLEAHWNNGNSYVISLNTNDGVTPNQTIDAVFDQDYSLPTPTRLGYTFLGWYDGDNLLSGSGTWNYASDKDLTAKWSLNSYTVEYHSDGGINPSGNPLSYTVEDDVVLEPSVKTGYTFLGWFDENDNKVTSLGKSVAENYVLTAKWSANLNTLTVNSQNENNGTAIIVSGNGYSGEEITVLAIPAENYIFKGWYHNSVKISPSPEFTFVMPTNDYDLEARFFTYDASIVQLEDVATPNVQIVFEELDDNCMVSPKVKAYIDAMEAQESTLENPYHFSTLYGPEDLEAMANKSDTPDGAPYSDEETGGVDVCTMLSRGDYGNTAKNYPIQLRWSNNDLTFSSAKLKFWSKEDFSDIREINLAANATSASLPNLFRAVKYRCQLFTDDDKVSQGFEFITGDYPRTITMGDVLNVRDIGGYKTLYGIRTTQGLMYRGYYIDDKAGGHGVNYSEEVDNVQKEVLKIGYELDLQKASETHGRTTSCLEGANYKCLTVASYENFLSEESYRNLPEIFSILANADQKHVYFHCWGGADRTGMLALFVNAICGVSYTDLIEDFEITTETNNKRCHMHNSYNAHFPKFINAFVNKWEGYDSSKTFNENCERWLIDVADVNPDDIEKIRGIMIPGYFE